ncbi:MAG: hypothetical protein IT480_14280 [Gammaproteobacteria bacterium]|nr:hypothetical protein [Gammaproteobacteria bacterium]
MWVIGFLLLFFVTAIVTWRLNRPSGLPPATVPWDMPGLATSYGSIIAPLAAFSVASAVFLANISRSDHNRTFENLMALFLIAFIMLMGAALMFATLRGATTAATSTPAVITSRRVMYILCNLGFYLGLNVSWLGLEPLLRAIGLERFAHVLSWILLFSILSGAARQGAWCRTLLGVHTLAPYTIAGVAAAAAALYRLGLVPLVRPLWPADAPLTICVVVFIFAAVIFSIETTMIRLQADEHAHQVLARIGLAILPPYIAAVATALVLLWFSLVLG